MCTILLESETLPAEKRSRKDTQKAVDRLMEYDRELSEPFSREELRKLFTPVESISKIPMIPGNYDLLTGSEKAIVDELGLTPEPGKMISRLSVDPTQPESVEDRRRQMKAWVIENSAFDGRFGWHRNLTGHIYVWLDSMCFGNSDKTGFYYVRWYNSMLDCHGSYISTAYGHPALIVQKNKLRPDQMEYMERKCRETRETAGQEITWPPR